MINNLTVEKRDTNVKPIVLRKQKVIPGVVFGPDLKTSIPVQAPLKDLVKALSLDGEIYQMNSGKETLLVRFEEIQRHPLTGAFVHFSLCQMDKTHTTTVEVALHTVGESKGAKAGGIIVTLKSHIPLVGMPQEIPGHIDFDVTNLEIGDLVHPKDIKLPAGLTIDLEDDDTLIACRAPHAEAPEEHADPLAEEAATAATDAKAPESKEK
jgi:large subunit ribosomal protein L25